MSLRYALRKFTLESTWLQAEFSAAASAPKTRFNQLAAEMVVIRLHDAWARFCRDTVISSASGTRTLGGTLIPPAAGITSRSRVIPVLLSKYKKRKFEPKWADANECIDAAQRLAVSNLASLSAALGASNSPADSIRRVRNFYAHRGFNTASEAGKTGLFANPLFPDVYQLSMYSSGGSTVIESWVSGLVNVGTAATQ